MSGLRPALETGWERFEASGRLWRWTVSGLTPTLETGCGQFGPQIGPLLMGCEMCYFVVLWRRVYGWEIGDG